MQRNIESAGICDWANACTLPHSHWRTCTHDERFNKVKDAFDALKFEEIRRDYIFFSLSIHSLARVRSFMQFLLFICWFVVLFRRMMAMSCCINCDTKTVIFVPFGLLLRGQTTYVPLFDSISLHPSLLSFFLHFFKFHFIRSLVFIVISPTIKTVAVLHFYLMEI